MPEEKSIHIDLFRCKDLLLRRKLLIFLTAAALFLAATAATAQGLPTLYSATATVYTVVNPGADLFQAQYSNMLLRSYTEVITSAKVLQAAADKIGNVPASTLQQIIRTHSSDTSAIIAIEAVSEDPALAISAANAVASVFVIEIAEITERSTVRHLDAATGYTQIQNGFMMTQGMRVAAGIGGALLACVLVLVQDIFFSSKVHTLPDAAYNGTLEVLAMIPDINKRKERNHEPNQDDL